MKKLITLSLIMLLLVSICSLTSAENVYGQIDWGNGAIQADGYGSPPANAHSAAQQTILARRAAIVDAYRNLLEIVSGVQIDSDTTVQDAIASSDVIKSHVSGFIKGARIIKEEYTPEGAYHVVMAVSMYGNNSLAKVMLPTIRSEIIPSAPSVYTPGTINPVPSSCSGLILDCRGMNLERIMAPAIYDEDGRIIYSSRILSDEVLINKGMMDYNDSTIQSNSRAGNNPLQIRPVKLRDFNRNIVVSRADGERILAAVKQNDFLATASVAALID